MNSEANVIGLDIGGAHLKVAHVANRQLKSVRQILCPLWKGLEHLDCALSDVAPQASHADIVAITMTGELSDLFETREQGVATIIDRAQTHFGDKTKYWMGKQGFGNHTQAKQNRIDVGSTNFIATAKFIAEMCADALVIDMGSTTTDIIPIIDGRPDIKGLTDPERLTTGELVYTGLTRTAVMAITNRVPFKGRWQTMAREYLATMADVYRILGVLEDRDDLHDTADGRGKSKDESIARLARMLCREAADASADEWRHVAEQISRAQLQSIYDGCEAVLTRITPNRPGILVRAGIGHQALLPLAQRLNLKTTTFGELFTTDSALATSATAHAPAVAVAMLSTPRQPTP